MTLLLFRVAISLCTHEMNKEGNIDRACVRTFQRCPLPVSARPPRLLVKNFFPSNLTSTIFIQSVNFIDRKCSLDSELSEFEGIIVIGDIY